MNEWLPVTSKTKSSEIGDADSAGSPAARIEGWVEVISKSIAPHCPVAPGIEVLVDVTSKSIFAPCAASLPSDDIIEVFSAPPKKSCSGDGSEEHTSELQSL